MASEPQRADLVRDGVRAETGVMQFDGDWPGIFVRGDEAMARSTSLREIAKRLRDKDRKETDVVIIAGYLERLAEFFASAWQDDK
jgi:folate-dependent phosphoribosylglycinamide formyltransferase PurN